MSESVPHATTCELIRVPTQKEYQAPVAMTFDQATAVLTAASAPFELETQCVRGVELRCWKRVPRTLRELVLTLPARGQHTYLVYEGERLSYSESFRMIAALARRLVADFGIQKGDRI